VHPWLSVEEGRSAASAAARVAAAEYEQDRRIGWEPEAGRGHPRAGRSLGHRWSYQLTPDGPDATVVTEIYDCSRAPEESRAGMDNGKVWIQAMAKTLERLDALCAAPASANVDH